MSLVERYCTSPTFSSLRTASFLKTGAGLLLCALATCALSAPLVPPAQAQETYTVNTASDDALSNVTCSAVTGDCTLRAALQEANSDPDVDTIKFGGDFTITLDGELVGLDGGLLVEEEVVIDGTTAPGYDSNGGPAVAVNGSNLSGDVLSGDADPIIQFLKGSGGSTVKALDFTGGPTHGVVVGEANDDLIGSLTALDLGDVLDALLSPDSGLIPVPDVTIESSEATDNDGDGIRLLSSGSEVSGSVVSGNGRNGVFLIEGGNGSSNKVTGNTIGLNRAEDDANPNSTESGELAGVLVADDDANVENNTVSGNDKNGIQLVGDDNQVMGNNVGTDGNGNVFANDNEGVFVGADFNSTPDGFDGSTDNVIAKNVVGGNGENGIEVNFDNEKNVGNEITGNYVGTNQSFDRGLGNGQDGIHVEADDTVVGTKGGANVVGFNGGDGIKVDRGENSTIAENYVGTSPSGADLGNDGDGVLLRGDNTTVGGGNVIGENGRNGIRIDGANGSAIISNFIGTDPSLEANLGNGAAGILATSNDGSQPVDNEIGIDEPSDESHELTGEDASPWAGWAGDDANAIANNGANNGGAGVAAEGDPSDLSIRGNMINDNAGASLDLPMPNLPVNVPIIEGTSIVEESQNRVQITYAVPEPEGADPSYPITVDFYRVDGEEGGPEAYLGNDKYEQSDFDGSCGTPPCSTTVTLEPDTTVTGSSGQSSSKVDGEPARVAATSTDAEGNTSELSGQNNRLPVEMAGLEALQSGSSVELTWQTASETNNAGFNVQLETEEGSWTTLGFVESRASGGTTTETQSYRYTVDRDLKPGTHRFRLQQTDLDGSSTLTEPVSVDMQMQRPATLRAPAPNPVSSSAAVSFAVKKQTETTVRLYNTLGQQVATVYEGTPAAGESQTARIEATDLPSGVYFLRLEADGRVRTERMTVVR
jgi:hypothetical protein